MAVAVIELVAIMHAGDWKPPEMVMRYIEHMEARKSGIDPLPNLGSPEVGVFRDGEVVRRIARYRPSATNTGNAAF
jgi:hypothetical protein